MSRLLILLALALGYRALLEVRGRLMCIESTVDEAVARLSALTADSAGGYETETFAAVGTAGRERIEAAQFGLEGAKWN